MRRLAYVAVAAFILSGCTGSEREFGRPGGPGAPEVGPDWSFTDTEGIRHTRNDSLGEPVLLFFMATWCGSCKATAPKVAQVQSEYQARGLDVFTLGWDLEETRDQLRQWKQEYRQPWPHGLDANRSVSDTFGVSRQSSLVILDADGFMSKRYTYASPSVAELRAALEAAYAR